LAKNVDSIFVRIRGTFIGGRGVNMQSIIKVTRSDHSFMGNGSIEKDFLVLIGEKLTEKSNTEEPLKAKIKLITACPPLDFLELDDLNVSYNLFRLVETAGTILSFKTRVRIEKDEVYSSACLGDFKNKVFSLVRFVPARLKKDEIIEINWEVLI
jgi:hypothetical protein